MCVKLHDSLTSTHCNGAVSLAVLLTTIQRFQKGHILIQPIAKKIERVSWLFRESKTVSHGITFIRLAIYIGSDVIYDGNLTVSLIPYEKGEFLYF